MKNFFKTLLLILLICTTSCTGNVSDTVKESSNDSSGTQILRVESFPSDTVEETAGDSGTLILHVESLPGDLPSQYEIDSIKKIRANFLDSIHHARRQDSIDKSWAIREIENKIRMNFPANRFLNVELEDGNYIIIDLGTGVLYKKELCIDINPGYVNYAYQSVTPLYDSLGKPLRIKVPPILQFHEPIQEK